MNHSGIKKKQLKGQTSTASKHSRQLSKVLNCNAKTYNFFSWIFKNCQTQEIVFLHQHRDSQRTKICHVWHIFVQCEKNFRKVEKSKKQQAKKNVHQLNSIWNSCTFLRNKKKSSEDLTEDQKMHLALQLFHLLLYWSEMVSVEEEGETGWGMPDYTRTPLKISGNRSDILMNPNVTFLVQIIMYVWSR